MDHLAPTWATWSTWAGWLVGSLGSTWPHRSYWTPLASEPLGHLGLLVSWLHLAPPVLLASWLTAPLCLLTPLGLYCPVPPGFTGAADPGGNWAPWPACALPQWPPLSSLSGRPAYWGSGHWPPWGLTGFLGSLAHWALLAHWAPWTCRLTGTGATESPCPWGGLRGQCPLARLGSLAALQRPLLHLARLGWRTGRLGRPSPARSGGRMHPHVASTVKSS